MVTSSAASSFGRGTGASGKYRTYTRGDTHASAPKGPSGKYRTYTRGDTHASAPKQKTEREQREEAIGRGEEPQPSSYVYDRQSKQYVPVGQRFTRPGGYGPAQNPTIVREGRSGAPGALRAIQQNNQLYNDPGYRARERTNYNRAVEQQAMSGAANFQDTKGNTYQVTYQPAIASFVSVETSRSVLDNIVRDHWVLSNRLATKAVIYEAARRTSTTPYQEMKNAVLGGAFAYGAIGSSTVASALANRNRFLPAFAAGGLWRSLGMIANKNTIARISYKGIGIGLAGVYAYEVQRELGGKVRGGSTPQQRLLGTGEVFGKTAVDVVGFGSGDKTVRSLTGTPFKIGSTEYLLDVREADFGRIARLIFPESRRGAIGGRTAKDRSGRITKAELRERKRQGANTPKFEIIKTPQEVSFSLRGKQRFKTEEVRVLGATFEKQKFDTRSFINGPLGSGVVRQPEYQWRLTRLDVAMPGERSPKIRPTNAPPVLDFWKPSNSPRAGRTPLYLAPPKPTGVIRTRSPNPQVLETIQKEVQKSMTQREPRPTTTTGNFQEIAYIYGKRRFQYQELYQEVSAKQQPYFAQRGSPEDRNMRALTRLRLLAASRREQITNQLPASSGSRFVKRFSTTREIDAFSSSRPPAFRSESFTSELPKISYAGRFAPYERGTNTLRYGFFSLYNSKQSTDAARYPMFSFMRDTAVLQEQQPALAQLPLLDVATVQLFDMKQKIPGGIGSAKTTFSFKPPTGNNPLQPGRPRGREQRKPIVRAPREEILPPFLFDLGDRKGKKRRRRIINFSEFFRPKEYVPSLVSAGLAFPKISGIPLNIAVPSGAFNRPIMRRMKGMVRV